MNKINWSSLVLRVFLGIMFTGHGLQKAFGLFGGMGISGFAHILTNLGIPFPLFFAYLVTFVELVGGIFLILGIFVRTFSFLLLIDMIVAILTVNISKGFFLPGGFEYNFIIISVCIALILMGPGKYSIKDKF
jgi:putative oxidoreductase